MVATKVDTLIGKLVEVAKEVRNIEKGGMNDAQNYKFVQEADVVRQVMPRLLDRGILFYPSARRVVSVEPFQTKGGTQSFLTTHESEWTATDGTDSLRVFTIGQGTDTGDKGVYKGMTGDKKYAILQLLGIATGDDPENEDGPSASQLKKLFAQGKQVGLADKASLQQFVLKRTGKYKSSDLTQEELDGLFAEFDVASAAGGTVSL